jgi:uracil-DNA glycosylase
MNLADLAATKQIAADWAEALAPVQPQLDSITAFLAAEREAGRVVLPEPQNILRAFRQPLQSVRVLIVGQDPYPTPGHPIGLSFATDALVRPLPRSLGNIYRELVDDLGVSTPANGDLTAWSEHGVMLLNRVLTVRAGEAGSHRGCGWEAVTDRAIEALVLRGSPLVAVLWGKDAQTLAPRIAPFPVIESAHPSPLSARNGFFGSRPFSRANALLVEQGAEPIDWRLASEHSLF